MAGYGYEEKESALKNTRWLAREPMTSREVAILDENADYLGVSSLCLMENAGKEVANLISEKLTGKTEGKNVVVFAGMGNNGGDGFVAARHLASVGSIVDVVLLGRPQEIRTREASLNYRAIEKMILSITIHIIRDSTELESVVKLTRDADVIVDAIMGTGVKGKIREPLAGAIALINSSEAMKISVDIPSGTNPDTGEVGDTAVRADSTITFHRIKKGLLSCREHAGEITVKGIGIPVEAEALVGPGDVRNVVKPRLRHYHKGDFGRILIIGGSHQYSGAPCYSALAALKSGAGLSIVAAPSSVSSIIRGFSPSLIVRDLPGKVLTTESLPIIQDLLDWTSATVIGPGLGVSDDTRKAFTEVLRRIREKKVPTVIDADALRLLAGSESLMRDADMILTPHLGEFKALTSRELSGTESLDEVGRVVSKEARKLGTTFLLKVANGLAVISDGQKTKVNLTGNPGMAKGGVGDVLSGIAATFLSWTRMPFEAAAAAAFVCGKAGDYASKKVGDSLTPRDIIRNVHKALKPFHLAAREEWEGLFQHV